MLTFMKYHSYVIRNAHRPLWKQANRPGCLTFPANLASSLLTEGPLTQPSQGVVTACVTRHADMRQKAGTRRSEAQNMHARTHTFLLSAHASTHKRKRKAWTICSHTTHGKHTHTHTQGRLPSTLTHTSVSPFYNVCVGSGGGKFRLMRVKDIFYTTNMTERRWLLSSSSLILMIETITCWLNYTKGCSR